MVFRLLLCCIIYLNMGVDLSLNVISTHDLNLTTHVPRFYRDILTVWRELHAKNLSTIMEYQHETIWNNRFIRIDGKPVFYTSWYRKGVTKIYHLLNESGNFLSRSDFQRKYDLAMDFLTYNGLAP